MVKKEITVVFYGRRFPREDWRFDWDAEALASFFAELQREFLPLGIALATHEEGGVVLDVRGYGDLLNTVRIRSNGGGLGNPCLGHVIGSSPNCNLLEDIRRGINRVAFAPETIEPDDHAKVVCHNCGCGC